MKMKKTMIIFACGILAAWTASAQESQSSRLEELEQRTSLLEDNLAKTNRFKVSGYIQAQYQHAQWADDGINFKLQNRLNSVEQAENANYSRFGIRRGRIKFTYDDGLMQAVFQPDFSQNGVSFKDAYFAVKDPWFGTNSLKAGLFDRPFGHEIAFSSSRRESPERSRIFQRLFPDERDLGAMLTLQPSKSSPLNIFKLEGGLFAGNGISPQISSKMDFIGRFSVTKPLGANLVLSGGVSGYFGGVLQNDESVYIMKNGAFQLREPATKDNISEYAKRQYIGVDVQLSMISAAGFTNLRAEYIMGEHPFHGGQSTKLTAVRTGVVEMRKISGGYLLLAQDLGTTPFTFVAKYDWYNPNTDVSGNDIAKDVDADQRKTGAGDITKSTVGLGLLWRIHPSLKLTAYYDIVTNETTENLKGSKNADGKFSSPANFGYEKVRPENVFTLRLQYKF